MKSQTEKSKLLSYLLRHSQYPDSMGWISLADLVERHGFTAEEIDTPVGGIKLAHI